MNRVDQFLNFKFKPYISVPKRRLSYNSTTVLKITKKLLYGLKIRFKL